MKPITNKVAAIVPVNYSYMVAVDYYHLVLTIQARTEEGLRTYREWSDAGKYIILDSPVIEKGAPERFEDTLALAQAIGASEILTPDWFQDSRRTLSEALHAVRLASEAGFKGRLMAAPQGKTQKEWLENCEVLCTLPIHTIGISYRYADMFGGNRVDLVKQVSPMLEGRKIHLLGCSLDPVLEAYLLLHLNEVQGVDSATSAIFTKHYMYYRPGLPRPDRNQLDLVHDDLDETLLAMNLMNWKDRCYHGTQSHIRPV